MYCGLGLVHQAVGASVSAVSAAVSAECATSGSMIRALGYSATARAPEAAERAELDRGRPALQEPSSHKALATTTGSARLYGTVLDSTNGRPIRSVMLVLLNGPVEVGALRTDALGQFDFDALAAASYRLSIRKEGFISSAIAVVATDGTAQPMPIFLTSLCADYWPIPYCRC